METAIPLIMMVLFFAIMLFIIRNQLGVKTFEEYATGNRSFGFMALTFSVLSTWCTGSMYTAWAGMTIQYGYVGIYVVAYATISLLTMYFVAPKTYVWGIKYKIATQPELMGFRYQSKTLRVLFSIWGIVFTVPWLIIEIVTQGIVFSYVTGGTINQFWGMVLGITIVSIYVFLGGMKSVVTANVFQGIVMIFGGTALMVYFIVKYFGGLSAGMEMVESEFPASLTFPGPGWDPATPYWTSIIILSGLGGFMWPWAYNKLFAGDSLRTIKKSSLLAPLIGMIFYAAFIIAGLFIRTFDQAQADPEGAFLWIAQESGVFILGFLGVIIMANSVGTVSGIIQSLSTLVSRDLAQVIKKDISDKKSVKIARASVILISIISLLIGTGDLGLMVFLALFTYDGIIMFFPIVIMGLYWKRANKEGAIISLLAGTGLSMLLRFYNPSFIDGLGWQPGVYGMILSFVIIIIAGYTRKPSSFVDQLWNDMEKAQPNLRKTA